MKRHTSVSVSGLLALMAELEPGLSAETVLGALAQAAAHHAGRRIAAAVTAQPGLLTGEGARAPVPGVLRFISALARAGDTSVVEVPCPRCGRQRQLGVPVEGLVRPGESRGPHVCELVPSLPDASAL